MAAATEEFVKFDPRRVSDFRFLTYTKGTLVYRYGHFRLYDKGGQWTIADDDGFYKGVYSSYVEAVKATDDEKNW